MRSMALGGTIPGCNTKPTLTIHISPATDKKHSACPEIRDDLAFADSLIAEAVTKSTWSRNSAWVKKFADYVFDKRPAIRQEPNMRSALADDQLILAFLAHVAAEQPKAKTRVDAAKRAVNFVRAIAGLPSLDSNLSITMLAKATRARSVSSVRQSPHMPSAFLHCIMHDWGASDIWWKWQITLMAFLAFCSIGRGDEVCSCLREGIAWVLQDGTTVTSRSFRPGHHCNDKACKRPNCVRGFLILFPSRKNHQHKPSWIPVASAVAVNLMKKHLTWLDNNNLPFAWKHMFLPRSSVRCAGKRAYSPPMSPTARMDVASFRTLLRQAVVECCDVSKRIAAEYGTHSPRLGAIELLRKHNVPAELRQQMGQWMSQSVALSYLQLPASEQFDVLHAM